MTLDAPQLTHVPADTPVEKIIEVIQRDGGVIIDKLYPLDLIERLKDETGPYFDKPGYNGNSSMKDLTDCRHSVAQRNQDSPSIARQVS